MSPERATDVVWWRDVLAFTREPGAWLLIAAVFVSWFWWKYGSQVIESVGRLVTARVAVQEAAVTAAQAHAKEALARAASAEQEADDLRNLRIKDLETRVAMSEARLNTADGRIAEHAANERACLQRVAVQESELATLRGLLNDTRQEVSDKAAALNAAITRMRVAEERDP